MTCAELAARSDFGHFKIERGRAPSHMVRHSSCTIKTYVQYFVFMTSDPAQGSALQLRSDRRAFQTTIRYHADRIGRICGHAGYQRALGVPADLTLADSTALYSAAAGVEDAEEYFFRCLRRSVLRRYTRHDAGVDYTRRVPALVFRFQRLFPPNRESPKTRRGYRDTPSGEPPPPPSWPSYLTADLRWRARWDRWL